MGSILVVYATREGQTRKVAERIATVLRGSGHVVELVDAERPPPTLRVERYQAVFIGSPVRAKGYLRSVVRFVQEHRSALQQLPTCFFSVGLALLSKVSDGRAQTLEIVEKFVVETGWRPHQVELVAGALPYSKYNFLVRFVMRRIARKEGGDTDTSRDYEYTDWPGVDRFATAFIESALGKSAPGVPAIPLAVQGREVARA